MPPTPIIDFNKTMVVGLDVTHPAPGAQRTEQSIAAMVASINSKLGQWPGTMARQQHEKEEVVFNEEGIKALLAPHLMAWKSRHKDLPKQISVYRDSVSEGQYSQVVDYEYEHMKKVCKEVYKGKELKITIVIIGKRYHVRFFKIANEGVDNPKAGTVVDREITSQFLWEFYFQAHQPIQGTARPSHYVVVVDNIFSDMANKLGGMYNNGAELIIEITHKLSYTMGWATKAIGVCTPAYLADKVCDRARFYPSPKDEQGPSLNFHEALQDSMFYI